MRVFKNRFQQLRLPSSIKGSLKRSNKLVNTKIIKKIKDTWSREKEVGRSIKAEWCRNRGRDR